MKTVLSNADFVSSLPKFHVEQSEDYPLWLKVFCQRLDCPSNTCNTCDGPLAFLVHQRTWKRRRKDSKGNIVYGRVCPYCHRTSRI